MRLSFHCTDLTTGSREAINFPIVGIQLNNRAHIGSGLGPHAPSHWFPACGIAIAEIILIISSLAFPLGRTPSLLPEVGFNKEGLLAALRRASDAL